MGKALKLSPEAVQQCVTATQELIDCLDDQIRRVDDLTSLAGAGGILVSAQQLMQGFADKARGRPDSVYARLMQFREVAIRMRDNFAAGGQGFAEMEAQFADALGGIQRDLQA
ncbi:hypothetical protein G4X40_21040 [Rhodococcus sp. D2-41]|uniref:hypothetical protein n=1 Tax=Speluncibacter jeojiensis TaxID=2710754 RepID=UPI00240FC136|nr:hypothetical protein [Rhodococcus sp. D2-41]MDG3012630.1 hypothetical protein [Rhodococcus sp. D2-41]